ncbi:MAG: hypothetical protein KDK08_11895 [Rhizobiaceae bacterium]|nr:hypothetical protein [Rhizobiaceae bacterium]
MVAEGSFLVGTGLKSAIQMCIHWLHSRLMKDAGLRIRVQRELRDAFLEVCKAEDRPAAQVLREFMRSYIQRHEGQASGRGQEEEQQ